MWEKKILETVYSTFLPWCCLPLYMLYFKLSFVYCSSCFVRIVLIVLCEFLFSCLMCIAVLLCVLL